MAERLIRRINREPEAKASGSFFMQKSWGGGVTLERGILLKFYYQSERGIPVDWSKIKREYIKGGISYRNLAEKYDVSLSTLKAVAGKERWVELRNQTKTKTDTKTIEIISDKEAERARRLLSISDRLLDRIEGIVEELTATEVIMDRTCLKQITGAMLDIQKIQGSKDALDIEEQRARIENLKKNNNAGNADENTYGVVFIPARSPKPVPPGDDSDG